MIERVLTEGERRVAEAMFGAAIDPDRVRIHHRKWWPLQPANVAMAPDGHLWMGEALWREDFTVAEPSLQALFVHELTHVWQAQRGGRWFLPFMRHPFCRYRYSIVPGRPFRRYGLEQQAMIVEHAWRARKRGAPDEALEGLLPFFPRPSV